MKSNATDLPGEELLRVGLEDLAAGRESAESLALAMAASRLWSVGIALPGPASPDPAHRLYELLSDEDRESAHSRYNALAARLASLLRAAEHAPAG
jgi:hypothetical protein